MMLRFSRVAIALVVSGSLALASASCKPKAGGKCQLGQAVCTDPSTVLACQGGVFIEAHCGGSGGCSKLGTKIECDDSVSEENEVCLASETDNRACSLDKKKSLLCKDGKFAVQSMCRGPKGCTIHGELVTCDSKLAEKNDPCITPGAMACSDDLKTRLVCKDGKMAFDRVCRGTRGCIQADLSCDESISDIGDPCGVSGMMACSSDEKQELTCQGGQFVATRQCKKSGCHIMANHRIECN